MMFTKVEGGGCEWILTDVCDPSILDLPRLVLALNTRIRVVYPWPKPSVHNPYAHQKSLVLLNAGFVPQCTRPEYGDVSLENGSKVCEIGLFNYLFIFQVFEVCGFENPIRSRPSEVQQELIRTRLENLLWRMLVSQANTVIERKHGQVEQIEQKFQYAEQLYNNFFASHVPYSGTSHDWLLACYDSLAELLPRYFKELLSIAPMRRIMDCIIHANVALPFTEMPLLMHMVR